MNSKPTGKRKIKSSTPLQDTSPSVLKKQSRASKSKSITRGRKLRSDEFGVDSNTNTETTVTGKRVGIEQGILHVNQDLKKTESINEIP